MLLLSITINSIASELLIIAAILLVLFIIFKIGNLIVGVILNSVLGLIAIYVLNSFFNLGIVYNLLTIIIVAITGLPGLAIIIILKLLGVSI